jgi:hypothetical protein
MGSGVFAYSDAQQVKATGRDASQAVRLKRVRALGSSLARFLNDAFNRV